MKRYLRRGIQYSIATILLVSAVGKLLDNRYAADLISQWQFLPQWSVLVVTLVLSVAELVLAGWLYSGRYLAQAALVAASFHGAYTLATVVALLRGIRLPDCGCFGILFAHPLDWVMAAEDLGFTVLSLWLFYLSRERAGLRAQNFARAPA